MKKSFAILFFCLLFFLWLRFSSAEGYSSKTLNSINHYSTIQSFGQQPLLLEKPHLVRAFVTHAAGIRSAGLCTLTDSSGSVVALVRGLPPEQGQEIDCLLIPRTFLVLEGTRVVICAMAGWRPLIASPDLSSDFQSISSHQ